MMIFPPHLEIHLTHYVTEANLYNIIISSLNLQRISFFSVFPMLKEFIFVLVLIRNLRLVIAVAFDRLKQTGLLYIYIDNNCVFFCFRSPFPVSLGVFWGILCPACMYLFV